MPEAFAGQGEIELETGGSLPRRRTAAGRLPLGYHRFIPSTGSDLADRHARPLPLAARLADLGLGGAALFGPQPAELGHRRSGRPGKLGRWSRELGEPASSSPIRWPPPRPACRRSRAPTIPAAGDFAIRCICGSKTCRAFAQLAERLEPLARRGRALNAEPADRSRPDLSAQDGSPGAALAADLRGDAAVRASFAASRANRYGNLRPTARWPNNTARTGGAGAAEYRRWENPAVGRFVAEHADRCRFFAWLQWLLDEQLAQAAEELPLMQDLPIGASPFGADAWAWQGFLAEGAAMGAPPTVQHAGAELGPAAVGPAPVAGRRLSAVRRDRALGPASRRRTADRSRAGPVPLVLDSRGLSRPATGPTFVIRSTICWASSRWRACGPGPSSWAKTWAPSSRACGRSWPHTTCSPTRWSASRIVRPAQYPRKAVAAVTTHDLPTVAGLWNGSDLAEQQALQLATELSDGEREMRGKLLTGRGPARRMPADDA